MHITQYQRFIFKRSYARYIEEEDRRENWHETATRYTRFMMKRVPKELHEKYVDACVALTSMQVMPSMRALWSAGEALENDNIAGYNCAYTPIDREKSFADILYILMNGAGVGFSVERQYINQLPEVPPVIQDLSNTLTKKVLDSKLGWASAFLFLIENLYEGRLCDFDYSQVRAKGAPLRTFGGRASGPEPLKELMEFTFQTFRGAQGRRLNSIEVYDIVCKIANCVVSGGVRRSATISLSNLSDPRMRDAKDGQFWINHPDRALSNNSVAYTEKPDMNIFMDEWMSLMKSGSGERGIVNRNALQSASPRREGDIDYGVNPCGEIALRPSQFCNLTEVIVRPEDDIDTLKRKVEYATIFGVIQSTFTDFKFLYSYWRENCEEERLLGVSLTGTMDNPLLNGKGTERSLKANLCVLREVALNTAKVWSEALGINMPAAVTCVKPSGTVSQLTNTSSGLHPRFSPYYIRRVRVSASDPVAEFLSNFGVPFSPETGQSEEDASTLVFQFPVKSPDGSIFRDQVTALEQLEYWKIYKIYWCEHNPSVTIYVKEHEWMEVGAWVYRNWDEIGGLSFLPYDGGYYPLAPYEEITEEKFHELSDKMPSLDWDNLSSYEDMDKTIGANEYACTGGKCEI